MVLAGEGKNAMIDIHDAKCKVIQIRRVFQNKFYKKLSSLKIRNFIQKLVLKSLEKPGLQMFQKEIEEVESDMFSKLNIVGNISVLCTSSDIMKK